MLEGGKSFPFLTLKEYPKVHFSLCAQIMTLDAVQLPILVAVEDCTGHVFWVFFPCMLALIIKPFIVIYVDLQLLLCYSDQPISCHFWFLKI